MIKINNEDDVKNLIKKRIYVIYNDFNNLEYGVGVSFFDVDGYDDFIQNNNSATLYGSEHDYDEKNIFMILSCIDIENSNNNLYLDEREAFEEAIKLSDKRLKFEQNINNNLKKYLSKIK